METAGATTASPKATDWTRNVEHLHVVNGILWVLRTGAPWRDLPERYGSWSMVASRFYRWREAGIWDRTWAQLQSEADELDQFDWEIHLLDGTFVRAHSTQRGKKTSAEALGRCQGGFSTKVHLRTDRHGRLMTLVLTPGQSHAAKAVAPMRSTGAVKGPGRGHPLLRPKRVVGDKGYCGKPGRDLLRRRGIRFTIAKRVNICRKGPFDRDIYHQRNQIERTINRFKHFRCIATRYETRAVNYLPMWHIAAILLAL